MGTEQHIQRNMGSDMKIQFYFAVRTERMETWSKLGEEVSKVWQKALRKTERKQCVCMKKEGKNKAQCQVLGNNRVW